MRLTYAVDPRLCEHKATSREYIAGMNTGDDKCYDCGLAMSKEMWAELRTALKTVERLIGKA